MYRIIRKEVLSERIKMVEVEAPLVARKALAGQFLIVRVDEHGERIPMTVADSDPQLGTVTIVFQEAGKTTRQMGLLEVGDGFENVVGPLGHPSEIENFGDVIVVAGGVGIAPIYPIARALKQAGNRVTAIIGARTAEMLFWLDRMEKVSDRMIVCTDDGSFGRHGLVTAPLRELLESGEQYQRAWVIGPAVMMKFASETTRPFGVPTIVSLNTVMIDGTGMCGGCRVLLKDSAQFVCVDGPEFDGHMVDWDNLLARLSFYREEEKEALQRWEHTCNLDIAASRLEKEQA